MKLDSIARLPLDSLVKGVPPGISTIDLGSIAGRKWSLLRGDLPMPAAVIKRSAVEHNSRWMRRFLELTGSKIAPHGKTTMCPQLFQRQFDDGAWGLTVATVQQMLVARAHGVARIILANQVIGRLEIAAVLDELRHDPAFDFYCLVDSIDGVRLLADAARQHPAGRPVQVLLEGGFAGGRTGVLPQGQAQTWRTSFWMTLPHRPLSTNATGWTTVLATGTPSS